MRTWRDRLIEGLVTCGWTRTEAAAYVTEYERLVREGYSKRVIHRLFGARGEANWYHVQDRDAREWVLRGTRVRTIIEEEANR